MNFVKKIILTVKVINNLYLFIFDFFGFLKNKEIVYKTKNNLKFITRGSSTDVAEVIVINGDLEYPKKFFKNLENSIILDIGANIGSFSLYCCNVLKNKNPKIYSIEPSIENFNILERNIKINNLENNIKAFNLALYGKDGKSFLNIGDKNDSFYISEDITEMNNKKQEIELVKLETFCSQNNISTIDLLKMDIEGGEYDVFYNSINFIKNNAKSIFVEVHNMSEENNITNFKKFILNNNFEIVSEISNSVLFLTNKKFSF